MRRGAGNSSQLRDLIRADITDGAIGVSRSPRLIESDLMERYGAPRESVRTALALLAAEGVITRRPGLGTVPTSQPLLVDLTPQPEGSGVLPADSRPWASELLSWDFVSTPVTVRARTVGSDWTQPCLRVVVLGQLGQERIALVTHYLRHDVAAKLERSQHRGDFLALVARSGVEFGQQTAAFQPTFADSTAAAHLGIAGGEIVQSTEQVISDPAGEVFLVAFGYYCRHVRLRTHFDQR